MNQLQCLRAVVAGMMLEAHQPGAITITGPADSFIRARLAPQGMIGIRVAAAEPLQSLARMLFEADARYKRGIPFEEFDDALFSALLELFYPVPARPIGQADVDALRDLVAQRFVPGFGDYNAYIPCAIVSQLEPPFTIGPVTFQTVDSFSLDQFDHASFMTDDLARLRSQMAAHNASWIATTLVRDVHEKHATTVAELVVDVALATVQLIVPLSHSRAMARLHDLRGPGFRIDLLSPGQSLAGSYHASGQPGFGLMRGRLPQMLGGAAQLVRAAGLHLTGLAHNNFSHPGLQMAWCDAAYWFRQGVRDNLDAIAVTKLETALEVMLSASSTTMGRERMYRAIEAFYGHTREDLINPHATTTVKQFVEALVTDRSRVLHGTLSTLATPMAVSRGQLERFCATMLGVMAVVLERYIAAGGVDDIDAFLAWAPTATPAPT